MTKAPIDISQLQIPASAQRMLAGRVREARVAQNLMQTTLAARAGVALPTLRRFEQTGQVSLKHLMRICGALGRLDEFENVLRPPPAATMGELESQVAPRRRNRGSR